MAHWTQRCPKGPVGCEAKSYAHNLRFQICVQKTEPGLLTPAPSTLTLLETDFEEGLALAWRVGLAWARN
jgi:hypothetical protein